jgi:rubrerythrin
MPATPTSIEEIFAMAIRAEEEAGAFYQAVEKTASNEVVKRLFLQLAKEEQQHKLFLEGCRDDPGVLAKLPASIDYGISDTVPAQVLSASMKPADAIALAMKKEQQAVYLYRSLAAATQDAGLRASLEGLSRMEQEHKYRLEEAFVGVGYPEVF